VTVETAAGKPLWLDNFDPINVNRLSPQLTAVQDRAGV
jgi:hypothetical protein